MLLKSSKNSLLGKKFTRTRLKKLNWKLTNKMLGQEAVKQVGI